MMNPMHLNRPPLRHVEHEQSPKAFVLNGRTRYVISVSASILTHCFLAVFIIFSYPFEPVVPTEIQTIHFVDLTEMPEMEPTRNLSVAVRPADPPPAKEESSNPQPQPGLSTGTVTGKTLDETLSTLQPFPRSPIVLERTGPKKMLNLGSTPTAQTPTILGNFPEPEKLLSRGRPQILAASFEQLAGVGDEPGREIALRGGRNRRSPSLDAEPANIGGRNNRFTRGLVLNGANATISGPLGTRKVLEQVVPQFPGWARKKKISARISLQFSVMRDGLVKESVVVARTSGSNEWDHLVIAALLKWRFVPLDDTAKKSQSGLITFQFVAE